MNSYEFAKNCAKFLSDKKAEKIQILSVADQTVVCSYFVVANGRSSTQVRALCDYVEEQTAKMDMHPVRQEGVKEGSWGVIDFGDVIVHIFGEKEREFYRLERLWDTGNNVELYKD